MSEPTVTLVIPSYRRGERIAATLASVAAQTRRPDETLVVNDGGFPETAEWVAANHPWVRVENVPHGGAAAARNAGARLARHPVLVFLDDDDTLRPEGAATLLRVLTTFPEARAAHCDHTYCNHITGERHENHHTELPVFARLRAVRPVRETGDVRLYGRALYYAMLQGNLLQQPWAVYRETYLASGGFRSGLGSADDWDLYLRLTATVPVAVSDAVVGNHYVEAGRPHLTLAADQAGMHMEAIRRQMRFAGWKDPRAQWILRRRLGALYKSAGDAARPASLRRAWGQYWNSLRAWPFDHVVAARTLLWPLRMLAELPNGRRRGDAQPG